MQTALETMYTESFGAENLAALRAETTRPAVEGAEPTLNLAGYMKAMRDALIAEEPVAETDLVALGTERTAAIRGYLIEMKTIPAERIEVLETDVHDDKGEDWVRCKLALGAME
jgi:hypothetical protein